MDMQNKRDANAAIAKTFVKLLRQHSKKSMADLERMLGIGWHGEKVGAEHKTGKAGETLSKWSKGRAKNVPMDLIQALARKAYALGLLPPLRQNCLRLPDIFRAFDPTLRASDIWSQECAQMQEICASQTNAMTALKQLADQMEKNPGLILINLGINPETDNRSGEIYASDIRALADQIKRIHFLRLQTEPYILTNKAS